MGKLTTQVFDLVHGRPATGMRIELRAAPPASDRLLAAVETNAEGRPEASLLHEAALAIGEYELTFYVGEYFGQAGFLGRVPIRFRVIDPAQNYHVPLHCTPWSYSTYRGA